MRLLVIIFLTFFLITPKPSLAELHGGLEYHIPIDYEMLSQEELENKAGFYYNFVTKNHNTGEEMTAALNLYSILSNKSPENVIYSVRLGILYDILNQDKYAKSNFYKAISINPTNPEAYFYFGEFYYKRNLYRKALRMYKEAYKNGYDRHYDTAYKLGDIYQKLGDTEAALRYLTLASELSPNSELDEKINKVKNADTLNKEYYSNTRIHNIQR